MAKYKALKTFHSKYFKATIKKGQEVEVIEEKVKAFDEYLKTFPPGYFEKVKTTRKKEVSKDG